MVAEKMFAEGVVRQIKEYLPSKYQKMECQVTEKIVNNDTCRVGISIDSPDKKTARIIYVEPFYEDFREGEPLAGVMEKIAGLIESSEETERLLQGFWMKDFQQAKSDLWVALVKTDENRRMLSRMPHLEIEDLSMVCQISHSISDGRGTMKVTHDIQKEWKVSKETLFDAALKNVRESDSYVMHEMSAVVNEIMIGSPAAENLLDMPEGAKRNMNELLYVLTNTNRSEGASVMLCPKVMDKVSRMFPEGFYLLPSSIHEVLVVPKNGCADARTLGMMVRDVNQAEVEREEVLSDRIYEYDKSRRTIRQIPESIERGRGMER